MEETLTVAFEKDGETGEQMPFRAAYGLPGHYRVAVIFTEPGEYMTHFEGEIEGDPVHTQFEFTVDDHRDLLYP